MKAFLDANLLIYLNTSDASQTQDLAELYGNLLKENLFTNILVVDETLYVSMSKYHVLYQLTFEFLRANVLPYANLIPIEDSDISVMEKYMNAYKIKPSDAIHLATMEKEGVANIVSEDSEFDKIREVKRIWLPRNSTKGTQ